MEITALEQEIKQLHSQRGEIESKLRAIEKREKSQSSKPGTKRLHDSNSHENDNNANKGEEYESSKRSRLSSSIVSGKTSGASSSSRSRDDNPDEEEEEEQRVILLFDFINLIEQT